MLQLIGAECEPTLLGLPQTTTIYIESLHGDHNDIIIKCALFRILSSPFETDF